MQYPAIKQKQKRFFFPRFLTFYSGQHPRKVLDKERLRRLLQLGLLLGRLEDGIKLGGEHHLALDLDLSRHEGLLSVELAAGEVEEVSVGDDDGDVGLGVGAEGNGAVGILDVESP